ncbi:MAG TPA: hypothetical protein VJK05_02920 [archaeon]|nr:hypothetical protein [archaeon]
MTLTPNSFYLTNVKYLHEKKQAIVEYSNKNEKFSERKTFFPKFYLSKELINAGLLKEVLSLYNPKKFKIIENEKNSIAVLASSFDDLKKIAYLVFSSFKVNPLILSPERQFLIENNLSFYDKFIKADNGLIRVEDFSVPEIEAEFLSDDFSNTLNQLIESNKSTASRLSDSIILSSILSVPVMEIPEKKALITEAFFEKMFFKFREALPRKEAAKTEIEKINYSKILNDFVEVDFSFVWPNLFSFPLFNLGFDSKNCGCCIPATINEKNLSLSSLIEVEFLMNGIYFESSHLTWSKEFHEKNEGKHLRERMQKEWFLKSIPAGPFKEKQKALIPLSDLKELLKENKARVLSRHELIWFCEKKESFLSKEISSLNKKIELIGRIIKEAELRALSEHKLMASMVLEKDSDFFYLKRFKENLSDLLSFIPSYLFFNNSKFFSMDLFNAVKVMQKKTLNEFNEFFQKNGSKAVQTYSKSFVKKEKALHLLKEFAFESSIPVPKLQNT